MFFKHVLFIFLVIFCFYYSAALKNGVKSKSLPVPGDPFAAESDFANEKGEEYEKNLQEQREKYQKQSDECEKDLQKQNQKHHEQIETYKKMLQVEKEKPQKQSEEYEKMLQGQEKKQNEQIEKLRTILEEQEKKHHEEIEKYKMMLQVEKEKHQKQSEECEKNLQDQTERHNEQIETYKKNLQVQKEAHQKLINSQNVEMNTFFKSIFQRFFNNLNINLNSVESIYQNAIIHLTDDEVKIVRNFLTSSDSSSSESSRLKVEKLFSNIISKAPEKNTETENLCPDQSRNFWIAIFVVLLTFLFFTRSFILQMFEKLMSPEHQKPAPIVQEPEADVNVEETLPLLPSILPSPLLPPPPPPPPAPLLPVRNPAPINIHNTATTFESQLATALENRRRRISEGTSGNESDDDGSIVVINDQPGRQQSSDNDEEWNR